MFDLVQLLLQLLNFYVFNLVRTSQFGDLLSHEVDVAGILRGLILFLHFNFMETLM